MGSIDCPGRRKEGRASPTFALAGDWDNSVTLESESIGAKGGPTLSERWFEGRGA